MDNTIIVGSSLSSHIAKETVNYLKKIGLVSDKYYDEEFEFNYSEEKNLEFYIEFKEVPFVFKILKYNNCPSSETKCSIELYSISEDGISFFIASPEIPGEILFTPMSNLISIHTIDKDSINRQICNQ